MSKHTPGPWSQDKYGNVIDAEGNRVVVTGISLAIGYCESDEPKENARLIAAAPDLLKVLETIVERFGPVRDNLIFSKRIAIDQARAAILKATGEQQ